METETDYKVFDSKSQFKTISFDKPFIFNFSAALYVVTMEEAYVPVALIAAQCVEDVVQIALLVVKKRMIFTKSRALMIQHK